MATAADTRADYEAQATAACEAGRVEAAPVRKKLDNPKLTIRPQTLPAMARLVGIGHRTVDAIAAIVPAPGDEALAVELVTSLRALPTIGSRTVVLFRQYFKEKRSENPRKKRLARLGGAIYRQDNAFIKAYSRYERAASGLGSSDFCQVVVVSAL